MRKPTIREVLRFPCTVVTGLFGWLAEGGVVVPRTQRVVTRHQVIQELEGEDWQRESPHVLPLETRVFLRAIDHRMNGSSVLASVPWPGAVAPDSCLAAWLDAGAPGLADAASECCIYSHAPSVIRTGPAPVLVPRSYAELRERFEWMLARARSFYEDVIIEDRERILTEFVATELDGDESRWSCFVVDVHSLAIRLDSYFEGLGNDSCHLWSDGTRLRILLTNGSD